MNPPRARDELRRAIRRLSRVVWFLVVVLALATIGYGVQIVRWHLFTSESTGGPFGSSPDMAALVDSRDFSEAPIRLQIEHASAILRTRNEVVGREVTGRIEEILLRRPEVKLYFEVGDEMARESRTLASDEMASYGMVVFLVGNPASMRYATSYDGERLGGPGGMTLDALRALIRESLDSGAGPPGREGSRRHSIEREVLEAEAVLITRNEFDGKRITCRVAEVLRQSPRKRDRHEVGDELPMCSRDTDDAKTFGEGDLVLISRGAARHSLAYEDGRLRAHGEIPLEILRQLALSPPESEAIRDPSE